MTDEAVRPSTSGTRTRQESTARRVYRRIALIAEDGVSLCCPDCGGRGVQTPLESMHGVYPPAGSPCGTNGCGGTVQEVAVADAKARLDQEVRQ